MTSNPKFACFLAATLVLGISASPRHKQKWRTADGLFQMGTALVFQPDALLKPSDLAPWSHPPPQANTYCDATL